MSLRKFLFLVLILSSSLTGSLVPILESQTLILHGDLGSPDSYYCALSGLKGMGSDCGTNDDEMVFTAEILSITPASNNESRLTVRPKTIFKGTPTLGMEILTAQQRCLPEMKIGGSWLFSLYREGNDLMVNYGSRSGPETAESSQIEILRRLAALDSAGIVKGIAYSEREGKDGVQEQSPSVDLPIVVTRVEDGRKSRAITNKEGEFEFEPLAPGEYDLEPNTRPGLWTMWSGKFDVKPHGCTAFDLDFHVDGQISGRLIFPPGINPSMWQVESSPADDPGVVPASTQSDADGRFVLHGLSPGKYIVKLEKIEMKNGLNLRVDLFAPGTSNRANARVIKVGKATRVEGIELVVLRSAIK